VPLPGRALVLDDCPAALDRSRREPVKVKLVDSEDAVGGGERAVHVAPVEAPLPDEVRARVGMQDRRVRIVSLTPKGKELIAPIFRKHAAEIRKVFAGASPKELRALETTLKKIGKRAESLGTGANPKCLRER